VAEDGTALGSQSLPRVLAVLNERRALPPSRESNLPGEIEAFAFFAGIMVI
jgi:hypothetical protein